MRVVHLRREPYTHQVSRPAPLGNPFGFKPSKFDLVMVQDRAEAIRRWELYARGDVETVAMINQATRLGGDFRWLASPARMMEIIQALPEDASAAGALRNPVTLM